MQTPFLQTHDKVIEKLIATEEVMINHFIFNKDQGLPVHMANSNVYMIILQGNLSLKLDDIDQDFASGQILTIPYGKMMHVRNTGDLVLELFVIKAPHPDYYGK